jgi:phenylpyruvate tautomerase PptA (4-oxalocrotonate tautomerase family)
VERALWFCIMPILDVLVVGEPPAAVRDDLARRIAEAAAAVLESRPQGTWVHVRVVPPADHAENAGGPDPGVAPVFVRILLRELPARDVLREQASRLAAAVAAACARPAEHVHLIYEPAALGRVAFGGRLVE